jgi:hypothetical protein
MKIERNYCPLNKIRFQSPGTKNKMIVISDGDLIKINWIKHK